MSNSANDCARELIEVIPAIMQAIRREVRSQRGPDLSVLQVRVLAFLARNPGAPLSAVAEHVGLTLPSMSTQVTGLVKRAMIERATSPTDRRYVTLTLTANGQALLKSANQEAQIKLAKLLTELSNEERATIIQGLQLLQTTFSYKPTPETENVSNGRY
ncbi:hypothetical protein BH10CHL1_BH10CHL1_26780 [soil metagenome]